MVDDDRREKNPSLILGGEIRVYYQGQETHPHHVRAFTLENRSQVTELDQASQDLLSHPRWEPFSELHRQRKGRASS